MVEKKIFYPRSLCDSTDVLEARNNRKYNHQVYVTEELLY